MTARARHWLVRHANEAGGKGEVLVGATRGGVGGLRRSGAWGRGWQCACKGSRALVCGGDKVNKGGSRRQELVPTHGRGQQVRSAEAGDGQTRFLATLGRGEDAISKGGLRRRELGGPDS